MSVVANQYSDRDDRAKRQLEDMSDKMIDHQTQLRNLRDIRNKQQLVREGERERERKVGFDIPFKFLKGQTDLYCMSFVISGKK